MNNPDVATRGALIDSFRTDTPTRTEKNATLVIFGRHEAEGKALEAELCEFGMDAVFVRIGNNADAAGAPVHQRRF
ncbi:hypothetical protein [Paraburkholderia sp. GAS334]|uniref:hypothetical protein n=1 Tax=Paraburkholderia sp. GAS334 TaxID=3035131 RepID=UPI003D1F2DDD